MFGFFKKVKAKAAQAALTEAFKARGRDFMTMNSTIHEAMVKEAMATGVEATMEWFEYIDGSFAGRAYWIIRHYKKRSKQF